MVVQVVGSGGEEMDVESGGWVAGVDNVNWA